LGLLPPWAKDAKIGASMINARLETVASKPAFRKAWQSRRCLVPATGYYEWRLEHGIKQPYWIHDLDSPVLMFAGLYEHWKQPGGEWLQTFALITRAAVDPMSQAARSHAIDAAGARVGRLAAWRCQRRRRDRRRRGTAAAGLASGEPRGEQPAQQRPRADRPGAAAARCRQSPRRRALLAYSTESRPKAAPECEQGPCPIRPFHAPSP
jgi:hypothetical protein